MSIMFSMTNILKEIDNSCSNKSLTEIVEGIDFIYNVLLPKATVERDILLFIVNRMEQCVPKFDRDTGEIL